MLKGRSLREIYILIKNALRLDARTASALEIAQSNRVLIEAVIGGLIILFFLMILFFKIPTR